MNADVNRARRRGADAGYRGGGFAVGPGAWAAVAAVALLATGWAAATAGEAALPPGEPGPGLEVSELQLAYGGVDDPKHALHGGHPGLPGLADLMQMEVALGKAADGYVAPGAGVASVVFRLADVPGLELKRFYASAILSVERQIVGGLNRRGLIGIFVAPHPDDLVLERRVADETTKEAVTRQEDRRPADRKALRLVIWTGVVTEVRTVASGGRVPTEERVNSPKHARIVRDSPVRPAAEGEAERSDLLRRDALERYTHFLSRHPGRRVDLALSSGDTPGAVVLDYLVNENKPWFAYAQFSNTGTKFTRPWRERFGFIHNQLTNHDDVFTLDYVTAGFDEAHAVLASYEAPFFGCDRLRWRVYGSWHEYTASDIGLAKANFEGEGWSAGGDLIANVFQHNALFVDALLGARWEHLYVRDTDVDTKGEEDLFVPHAGLRFERLTETATTWGSLMFEWNHCHIADTDLDELGSLGRLDPDKRFAVLKFDAAHAFYLEPLLDPAAWADPSSYKSSTLAHELAFSVRGQHALGTRLIPQYEQVVGGLYSVRGYPESLVAGDSVTIGSVEYRFHVPRIFKPNPEPGKLPLLNTPFRYAPQQVYGRPDWDLILRAFYDVGRTSLTHRKSFEKPETLQGAGVGFELRIRSNMSVRCDYGVALADVDAQARRVDAGNKRIHAVLTFSF